MYQNNNYLKPVLCELIGDYVATLVWKELTLMHLSMCLYVCTASADSAFVYYEHWIAGGVAIIEKWFEWRKKLHRDMEISTTAQCTVYTAAYTIS